MSAQLKLRSYHTGRKKARRYMNEMATDPIYPKMNLSKRQKYGLQKAFHVAKPEIFNSDQGCQFTSHEYKQLLKDNNIKEARAATQLSAMFHLHQSTPQQCSMRML